MIAAMPEICRFLGIIIRMYFDENRVKHHVPHFHVYYNEYDAVFHIDTLEMIEGKLPSRVKGLVVEWATIHQKELKQNWKLGIRKDNPKFKKIDPLV